MMSSRYNSNQQRGFNFADFYLQEDQEMDE